MYVSTRLDGTTHIVGLLLCSDYSLRVKMKIMIMIMIASGQIFKPVNAELNSICHLLALLGAHRILYVSRIRVKSCSWIHPVKISLNKV
jgi:hypothetical protein